MQQRRLESSQMTALRRFSDPVEIGKVKRSARVTSASVVGVLVCKNTHVARGASVPGLLVQRATVVTLFLNVSLTRLLVGPGLPAGLEHKYASLSIERLMEYLQSLGMAEVFLSMTFKSEPL